VEVVCLDLEGVLVPEIWINVAARTGIDALRATTRDIPDYDVLMRQRLGILDEHNLRLDDIQSVIAEMGPMEGAREFLQWLRENFQITLLSDTFYEFAEPLMRQLDYPMLLCHRLDVNDDGRIVGYNLRQQDAKKKCVTAFQSLSYRVIAAGDSYNDTAMLEQADTGILFRPPDNVIAEFPQFPVTWDYAEMRAAFAEASEHVSVEGG
jgi:phosphoserine / homoserine phosphotransferase